MLLEKYVSKVKELAVPARIAIGNEKSQTKKRNEEERERKERVTINDQKHSSHIGIHTHKQKEKKEYPDCFVHSNRNNIDSEIDTELGETNYSRFYLDSMTEQ